MTENAYYASSSVGQSVDVDFDVGFDQLTDRQAIRELQHFKSVADLVDKMTVKLGFAAPDARHVITVFGAGRVERAYLKTMWDTTRPGNRIRGKVRWLMGALKHHREWSYEELKEHLAYQREHQLREWEASDNLTEQAWARREREKQAGVAHLAKPKGRKEDDDDDSERDPKEGAKEQRFRAE